MYGDCYSFLDVFRMCIGSVSYTHLDVYKRQGKNYVMELEYMNKKHWIDDIPVLLQCLVNIQDRIKAGLD